MRNFPNRGNLPHQRNNRKKTMKLTKTATKIKPGMTLIEITVVILVLLTLISVLFIGANIYKKGADRAACILNIRNVHQAVRANQNLNAKNTTDDLLRADIIGLGRYLEAEPQCPTSSQIAAAVGTAEQTDIDGNITAAASADFAAAVVADYPFASATYPAAGIVAVKCAQYGPGGNGGGATDHIPNDVSGW
jgi:type II secretory pathway pseudopilin PulG